MNRVRKQLEIEEIWKHGIVGKGITCAVVDSGIGNHSDLLGRVKQRISFIQSKGACHGTGIAGIIGGAGTVKGKYKGIAPQVEFVSIQILDEHGNGDSESLFLAVKWICENRVRYGIRIVNLSFGNREIYREKKEKELLRAVNHLWDEGIVVVAAAGNEGANRGSITIPGSAENIITVGATIRPGVRFGKSSVGPTKAGIMKPDLLAPGVNIISCGKKQSYHSYTGTSMSAAVVSGCVALILQQQPWLCPKEIKEMLCSEALDLGLPMEEQGNGELNIKQLLKISKYGC